MLYQFFSRSSTWQTRLLTGPYSLLLLLLLGIWISFGVLPKSISDPLVSVQMAAAVAVTFKSLVVSRRKQLLYLSLAGLTLGVDLVFGLTNLSLPLEQPSAIALSGVWALYHAIAIVLVSQSIFGSNKVTFDTVIGGICIFLMMGYMWFAIFGLLLSISPASLSGPNGTLTDFDVMYFSFSTLTTVGYGDIVPVSRLAKVAANLEAIVGVLYPAIFIAKLVSSYQRDKADYES